MDRRYFSGSAPRAPALRGIACALALATLPAAANAADIAVTVENVKSTDGALMVALYASAEDYRKKSLRGVQAAPAPGAVSVRFDGVPAGDYAIAMFHDRNGNGKLDSNLMGIPTEPYGFSGDQRPVVGPPDWQQAKFGVTEGGATVTVRLSD